jgi:hypothetical protein
MRAEERLDKTRRRLRDPQLPNNSQNVHVYVQVSTCPEALSFAVPVPPGANLADLLKQLGKNDVNSCLLSRNGSSREAGLSEVLLNGDRIFLELKQHSPARPQITPSKVLAARM